MTLRLSIPCPAAEAAGRALLEAGASAVEALVAAAAVLGVTQPDHTGLGGDGVWMIARRDAAPVMIESVGRAAAAATEAAATGPLSVLTPPGAVAGWAAALADAGTGLSPARLLEAAVAQAAGAQAEGPLRRTLERLAAAGWEDLYAGALADDLARDLAAAGSPVGAGDLARHAARRVAPLRLPTRYGVMHAPPPPSTGLTALLMLGIFDRLEAREADGFDHLHSVIEAAKQAVLVDRAVLGDPDAMTVGPEALLSGMELAMRASDVVPNLALAWPVEAVPGDTVALVAEDAAGTLACTVQSLGAVGGSGVVSERTGIRLHNRGAAFTAEGPRALAPGRLPRHALAPVLAELKDGRRVVVAATGGDAAAQRTAQALARMTRFGADAATAMAAPAVVLEAEDVVAAPGLDGRVLEGLRAAGHAVREAPLTASVVIL